MAMTIERMLTEEEPAGDLVGRVLQEAGIEYVFGISGGHTGRIVSGLRKYQNSLRMVLVREESLAGVMAEVYGRLTRRPGVMIGQGPWVLGNGMIGTIEAFLSSSPISLTRRAFICTHRISRRPATMEAGMPGARSVASPNR
jgi:acetolactate synthase-1/2/3 large subunit